MKYFSLITAGLLAYALTLTAQLNISKEYSCKTGQIIVADLGIADTIYIETWPNNNIKLKSSININNNKNNDAFSLKKEALGNQIIIKSEIDKKLWKKSRKIIEKNGCSISYNCIETKITYKLYLPEGHKLILSTISGNIEVKSYNSPIKLKSISGFIDLGVPAGLAADLSIKTVTGNIFTDLDLSYKEETRFKEISPKVQASINGGGTSIELETISSNIYVRKQK